MVCSPLRLTWQTPLTHWVRFDREPALPLQPAAPSRASRTVRTITARRTTASSANGGTGSIATRPVGGCADPPGVL
jgi:hypothetical protein